MSLQLEENKTFEVRFYLNEFQRRNLEEMSLYLFRKGGIRKPSIHSFFKAAGLKMYQDLHTLVQEEQKENAKQ